MCRSTPCQTAHMSASTAAPCCGPQSMTSDRRAARCAACMARWTCSASSQSQHPSRCSSSSETPATALHNTSRHHHTLAVGPPTCARTHANITCTLAPTPVLLSCQHSRGMWPRGELLVYNNCNCFYACPAKSVYASPFVIGGRISTCVIGCQCIFSLL
jgi:hypothetical protein